MVDLHYSANVMSCLDSYRLSSDKPAKFADSLPKRKGARVDEWNGLENRQGCKPLGGSNPPPSAMEIRVFIDLRVVCRHMP